MRDAKTKLQKSAERLRELQRETAKELAALEREIAEDVQEHASVSDALEQLEQFRADMCKCATKECAENVSKKMDDWSKSQGEAGERAARAMSEADKRKGMAIAEAMGKCMMKAMAVEPPGR